MILEILSSFFSPVLQQINRTVKIVLVSKTVNTRYYSKYLSGLNRWCMFIIEWYCFKRKFDFFCFIFDHTYFRIDIGQAGFSASIYTDYIVLFSGRITGLTMLYLLDPSIFSYISMQVIYKIKWDEIEFCVLTKHCRTSGK